MREDSPRVGPLVLNIRVSGRLVPLSALLLLFALLPFLGGSAPANPTASVVLAAGAPAEVNDAVAAVDQARNDLADSAIAGGAGAATAPAGSAFADALGGGLFMFPAIELTPLAAQAIAAPIIGGPTFIHPVPGGETSPFGPRVHPVLGRPMFHTGIDLAAVCGTPIRAAAAGKVIYAEVSNSWGLRTIIEHTPTLKTAYGHQSRFLVKEGDVVKQGQVIGLVGTTGWSTGCHLHFDVILNDRYVDPAPYLGFPPSDAKSVPYSVVPHVVFDQGGRVVHTVEDGDVPLPDATSTPPTSSPTTSRPTTGPTQTHSTPPPTTKPPTTTTPPPSTSTPPPSTSTDPPTSSTPPPSTTSDPPPATTTTDPPTTSDPPATTSQAAPPPSSDPTTTATETATATATEVLQTATEAATTAAATDTTTSEPAPQSTTAAEGGS